MSKKATTRIVFTGGGTGGHVFPLIAVGRSVFGQVNYNRKQPFEIIFIGPINNRLRKVLLGTRIRVKKITAGKIHRNSFWKIFIEAPKIILGFLKSYVYLWFYMPDLVFSKGGYGSFPVVFVAWLFRIPVVMHESDSKAGLSNKIMARFAKQVFTSFESSYSNLPEEKTKLVGNPVRNIRGGDPQRGYRDFNIKSQKPVILIIGGSQGALQLNSLIIGVLEELAQHYEIIHQTGNEKYQRVVEESQGFSDTVKQSYHPTTFLNEEEMRNAFAVSHLVVSRAGSGAIFEIAFAEKPSIIIPLEKSANDHQEKNALAYQETGACVVLSPQNVTPHILLDQINMIMGDRERMENMQLAARKFAKPEAASEIAKTLLEYIK